MSPLATFAVARNKKPSLISHFILSLWTNTGPVRTLSMSLKRDSVNLHIIFWRHVCFWNIFASLNRRRGSKLRVWLAKQSQEWFCKHGQEVQPSLINMILWLQTVYWQLGGRWRVFIQSNIDMGTSLNIFTVNSYFLVSNHIIDDRSFWRT